MTKKYREAIHGGVKWVLFDDDIPADPNEWSVTDAVVTQGEYLPSSQIPADGMVYSKGYSEWRYYAVPFGPLSHNNAYGTARGGKRFKIAEYEEYANTITDYIRLVDYQCDRVKLYGDAYEVSMVGIYEHSSFFFKNGSFKKIDPDGFIKLIQDAVFKFLETDDSSVIKVTSYKVEMTPLPFEEQRYSENPTWDLRGGVFCIGIRTVPVVRASEIDREEDPQLAEMINQAVLLDNYVEPRLNMNRGKREQQRRLNKINKKTAPSPPKKTKAKRKR